MALGRISYSLYLWQQLFLVPTPLHERPLGTIGGVMFATMLTAAVSYLLIESPAIELGRWATARIRLKAQRLVEDTGRMM